jgi:hypothetical protein
MGGPPYPEPCPRPCTAEISTVEIDWTEIDWTEIDWTEIDWTDIENYLRRERGGQTSKKRRMAMPEPSDPINTPTNTTTISVEKTSQPVMCMALNTLLELLPPPA